MNAIFIVGYPYGGPKALATALKKHPDIYGYDNALWAEMRASLPRPLREPRVYAEAEMVGFAIQREKGMGQNHYRIIPEINITQYHNEVTEGYTAWNMASNKNIEFQYFEEGDYFEDDSKTFKDALDYTAVLDDCAGAGKRLVDYSTGFLLKTRYIQALLEPEEPYFIYVVANPFNLIYNVLEHDAMGTISTYIHLGTEKVEFKHHYAVPADKIVVTACENLMNSYAKWNEDRKHLKHAMCVRNEDLGLFQTQADIYDFLGMEINLQRIIRYDALRGWTDTFDKQHGDYIKSHCAEYLREFYPRTER